jgi:hypothetical protein
MEMIGFVGDFEASDAAFLLWQSRYTCLLLGSPRHPSHFASGSLKIGPAQKTKAYSSVLNLDLHRHRWVGLGATAALRRDC